MKYEKGSYQVWGIQASVDSFADMELAAPGILEMFVRSIKGGFGG